MNFLTSELVFYVFAALALITAVLVVVKANPVGSAVCLALCFLSAAAVMFQLDAVFLGVIQILVYTGAIMVLILFVVMLLDLKDEKKAVARPLPVIAGLLIAGAFMFQIGHVIYTIPGASKDDFSYAPAAKPYDCALEDLVIGESSVWNDIPVLRHAVRDLPDGTGFRPYLFIPLEDGKEVEFPHRWLVCSEPVDPAFQTTEQYIKTPTHLILPNMGIEEDDLHFTSAQPPIGQSPAIKLPEIAPQNFTYPKGSSVVASISQGEYPDTSLLGYRLFAKFNKELVILSLALLVAAIGAVVLTRKPGNTPQN